VIGVAWTGSESDFEDFVGRHGLTFPSLSDDAGDVYDRFQIPYQPAFALVRPDGRVETVLGSAGDDVIDMIIRDATS
jgi:peroxiredoxin